MSKVLDLMTEVANITENTLTINHSARTRFEMFVPETHPAACYQLNGHEDVGETLKQDKADNAFSLTIFYIEEADVNRDQTDFITNVENLKDTLRDTGDLNSRVLWFDISIEYDSQGGSEASGIEFFAKITIEGVLPY